MGSVGLLCHILVGKKSLLVGSVTKGEIKATKGVVISIFISV